ncbi:MAG: phytanoyl-CoA dioxygenase family protein, partial [Eggerthellaceae bacterium]|nr:phytanoyl-CoA dioxygenase family protein [Eggerthellaceae bacterium]
CCDLAGLLRKEPRIRRRLPQLAVAVQCTFFDKSDRQNWLVAFHQDLLIPVEQRIDSPDCAAWSEKEGAVFVQPPTEVLRQLVAVRVHLDNSATENGLLRVLPRSHQDGRLRAEQIQQWRRTTREVSCLAPKGSVLLMSPLLLHASSKAKSSEPRRVLHFLFGPPNLPSGLKWRSFNGDAELPSE